MMFNYPFLNFKNRTYPLRYYNYPTYTPQYNKIYKKENNEKIDTILEEKTKHRPETKNNGFLSLLGIRLYYDDLIILALLYFLYKEEVQDEGLFLTLILLLLS